MSGTDALRRQLAGARPPAGVLDTVDDADLERLAGVMRDAHRRQSAALMASADNALAFMPRLIRIPVKKVLGL